MKRILTIGALLASSAAYAYQSTWLDELRYSMYRLAGINAQVALKSTMNNVDPDEVGTLTRWSPEAGEEGQFSAVRFTPALDFSVREITYLAPNSTLFGIHCTVSDDRIVNLYVTSELTPPNNATPDVSVIVPGQPGAVEPQLLFEILLADPLLVPKGESLFVAIEHTGVYPDVGCLTVSTGAPERVESEFWSYATDVPFDWTGWEALGGYTYKPLVSVSGYVEL